MPTYETLPVKVSLAIEVDGHRFTFEGSEKATGSRYHGQDPRSRQGFDPRFDKVLEQSILRAAAAATGSAAARSAEFLRRAYPIHGDVQ